MVLCVSLLILKKWVENMQSSSVLKMFHLLYRVDSEPLNFNYDKKLPNKLINYFDNSFIICNSKQNQILINKLKTIIWIAFKF